MLSFGVGGFLSGPSSLGGKGKIHPSLVDETVCYRQSVHAEPHNAGYEISLTYVTIGVVAQATISAFKLKDPLSSLTQWFKSVFK